MREKKNGGGLETAAGAVWRLAVQARHDGNYGRILTARNQLKGYLRAPHPKVRRIAVGLVGAPKPKRAA